MLRESLSAQNIAGVWTALVTPFTSRGVHWGVWEDLIERAVEAGITGVVVLGSTGESPTVKPAERRRLIETAVAHSRGLIRVMVGAGSYNLDTAIDYARQAESLGADGLLVVTPYYSRPTRKGLDNYFLRIADASSLPLVLYHIPARTAVGIPVDLVVELAKHPKIIGIKEAGGDVLRVSAIAQKASTDFTVLAGDDPLTLPMMSVGAKGIVSVVSNLVPLCLKRLVDLATNGDYVGALLAHRQMTPLFDTLFLESNPAPVKEAMRQQGIAVGNVRAPLAPVTAKTKAAIRNALLQIGDLK